MANATGDAWLYQELDELKKIATESTPDGGLALNQILMSRFATGQKSTASGWRTLISPETAHGTIQSRGH